MIASLPRLTRALSVLILLCNLSIIPTEAKPLKVFVLAGQSNMQGHAKISTFEHIGMDPATAPLLASMEDANGNPTVCENIWISYLSKDLEKNGKLTTGFGATEEKIGPEFLFGITLEKHLQEPVLIIKTAWGGKSLHTDFRPPGAGPYQFTTQQLENIEKRGKDIREERAAKTAATGHYYRLMTEHVRKVLADIETIVPDYNPDDGYELAGFVWFQGWNDMVDSGVYPQRDQPGGYDAYSKLLTHFILDVRRDLNAPAMPFVIGVMGVGGPTKQYVPDRNRYAVTHQNFRDAMAAPAALPEFKGNVTTVFTETAWDPELQALTSRDEKLKQAAKKIQREQELKGAAAQAILEDLRAKEFSETEREILAKGISNQAYHYLGSAKIMALIGQRFAAALIDEEIATR